MPSLELSELDPDPIAQFGHWYERAVGEVPLSDAMTLATVDASGAPDARLVLLKGFDRRGFRFFTNANSTKGAQLEGGSAALVIYWRELDRQVRIRGGVEAVAAEEADEYFASRPRDSQIGAWASPQSDPLTGRELLDSEVARFEARYDGEAVPRPPHWRGYRVRPVEIELWQGQKARLHNRFRYLREPGVEAGWRIERLAP